MSSVSVELSLPLSRPLEPRIFARSAFGKWCRSLWPGDLAMDLGTANTLIYLKDHGIVLNEPSALAVEEDSGKILAIGALARQMFGKTAKAVRCVRPMKDGVIADFAMTSQMINYMLLQVCKRCTLRRPRLVVGVPSGITQVEKRAVVDAALEAGIRQVMLVEESMAAALGADLPVDKAVGNMIVDIGGGTTEAAIISMNGTVYSHSIRVAGDEMDEAIQREIRRRYGLEIGIFEAERVKMLLGSALPFEHTRRVVVYGRETASSMPRQLEVSDDVVRTALNEPLTAIISSILAALEQTSAETAQDVMSRGVYLAGGGALLKGLTERLFRETGIPFHRALDPLSCVVRGVGKIVDRLPEMRALCIS